MDGVMFVKNTHLIDIPDAKIPANAGLGLNEGDCCE